jgi:Mn2+/Fe2+ NRAMP family transporter
MPARPSVPEEIGRCLGIGVGGRWRRRPDGAGPIRGLSVESRRTLRPAPDASSLSNLDDGGVELAASPARPRMPRWLWVVGPGLMVMLADTDAGSIITAAQSGASWGYHLLLLEVLLIPVLFLLMELTVRLGIATGKGHAQLIREHFGRGWVIVSVGTLCVSALGALVTEFAGVAGAARLLGLPPGLIVPAAALILIALVVSGGYRRVEIVGITLGLFELAFVVAAVAARPGSHALASGLSPHQPFGDHAYLALVAANVGAVIMPWMIFFQQGAVLDKRLDRRDLRAARIDTALGAVLTQLIMIAVLVAMAASTGGTNRSLSSVGEIARALTPSLGDQGAKVALALGLAGAGLVASIVVSLATAWAVSEAVGAPRSLNDSVRQARLFYLLYSGAVVVGAALVLASNSLVRLAVGVEILNALVLPLVLGMLILLAHRVLPRQYALRRAHRLAIGLAGALVLLVGLSWVGLSLGL